MGLRARRLLELCAGGDLQRFGQTPCVVEGKICPHEGLETGAGSRRRHAVSIRERFFLGSPAYYIIVKPQDING